jgi:hypothetical protein
MYTKLVMLNGSGSPKYDAPSTSSTFPASCHVTPVNTSIDSAPKMASIAHRPWISSHSRNLYNPNTSLYG